MQKQKWGIVVIILLLLGMSIPAKANAATDRKWQDEMMYFIMVDRFNNGDVKNDGDANPDDPKAYHGGDIQGIIEKLDYIKDMGFTSIWLTPIFDNEQKGYHGYWIQDFYKVDEHFGTIQDFKKLVKEAHKRDMKVILDFVANHTGYQHPWLKDPAKKDWFHEKKDIVNWNSQDEIENGWLYGLPDLNQENPDVKKYLIDAGKWWIEETDIDGYRLDTVRHVPKEFWTEFSEEMKKTKKGFFLLGEVWNSDPRYLAEYQKIGIDAMVDFPLYDQLTNIFSNVDESQENLIASWKRNKVAYPHPYLLGTFLDNHDTERFTRQALRHKQYPVTRTKLGLTYLYGAPGIPIVYYGTEITLDGGKDPDNRRLMNFQSDKELGEYVGKLAELRRKHPSLRRGTFDSIYEENGMAIYKRTYKNETTLVAINNTSKNQVVDLKEDFGRKKELRGLLESDFVRPDGDVYKMSVNRETANIYVVADKSGLNIPYIAAIVAIYVAFIAFLYFARKRRRKA